MTAFGVKMSILEVVKIMRVVFDFDGVVCYSQVEMMRRLSKRLCRLITVDDWKIYNMHENFDAEVVAELKSIFTEDVYNGAREDAFDANVGEAINMLYNKGHDVSIETLCDSETTYLNKVRYLQNKGLGHIEMTPVFGYDKIIKADIVVEDCYENLEKADAKIKILITRPWNKRFKTDMVATDTFNIPHKSLCKGSDDYDTIIQKALYIRVDNTEQLTSLLEKLS